MSYEKTVWASGDVITAEKLNKIESGVQASNDVHVVHITWAEDDSATIPKSEIDYITQYRPIKLIVNDGSEGEEDSHYPIAIYAGYQPPDDCDVYIKLDSGENIAFTFYFASGGPGVLFDGLLFTLDGDVYKYIDNGD